MKEKRNQEIKLKLTSRQLYHCGLWGPASIIIPGVAFGVPPIVSFGNEEIQNRLLPDLFTGRKRSCIAITEPSGGSDVANMETVAVKTPDGKHYVVNGTKKWLVLTHGPI